MTTKCGAQNFDASSHLMSNHIEKAISKNYNYVHNLIFISCYFHYNAMDERGRQMTTTSTTTKEWACLCGLEWPFFSAQGTPHKYEKWIPSTSTFYLQTCKWVSGSSFAVALFAAASLPHIYFRLCFCVNFRLNCSLHLSSPKKLNRE